MATVHLLTFSFSLYKQIQIIWLYPKIPKIKHLLMSIDEFYRRNSINGNDVCLTEPSGVSVSVVKVTFVLPF